MANSIQISPELLAIIVCPACRGQLHLEGDVSVRCMACGRAYPIVDGIPVLILDRASVEGAL
jgi:uncharacterized protein